LPRPAQGVRVAGEGDTPALRASGDVWGASAGVARLRIRCNWGDTHAKLGAVKAL